MEEEVEIFKGMIEDNKWGDKGMVCRKEISLN